MSRPAIPAATLILFREAAGGPPELLFVERSRMMRFAGGAIVFPGGRVDAADHALSETGGGPDDWEEAARIAAIRECVEEAGVAAGIEPAGAETVAAIRHALNHGSAMGEALAAADAVLRLDALVPYARWRPDFDHARSFDTRFYLAKLPADAPEAVVDATENVRTFWATAAEVLAMAARGEARLIFPTRCTLERLATHDGFDAAAAAARAFPVRTITPWIEQRDGADWITIPGDLGYPVTALPLAAAARQ
ncbi:NUDIX domain-containing protein [Sphingomonas sp. BGYR3]|uniref:NUDIX hydrolase n=1 Tax=Sphingomonas sp. BGYR3 TaxID=2975483 RepID=UPI0021A54077|nr:NUDIX domain-containing protein [Sphingomonas sp. BGYR3]MDG5488397.1 NUDIX domain-containing protein [Sphingomonas sp. BGYR3]